MLRRAAVPRLKTNHYFSGSFRPMLNDFDLVNKIADNDDPTAVATLESAVLIGKLTFEMFLTVKVA